MAQSKSRDDGFKAHAAEIGKVPAIALEHDIDAAIWHTLKTSLYPGAQDESVIALVSYCKARSLDPLKRVAHIVPMSVTDARSGKKEWRDVIMPGIAELRITAHRTGEYAGLSDPTLGPEITIDGVRAPAWCRMVAFRQPPGVEIPRSYPATVYFREAYGKKSNGQINSMWAGRPIGQLTKCTEAAALRQAFPEELGGQMSAEEAAGQDVDGGPNGPVTVDGEATPSRPSTSAVAALRDDLAREAGENATPDAADGQIGPHNGPESSRTGDLELRGGEAAPKTPSALEVCKRFKEARTLDEIDVMEDEIRELEFAAGEQTAIRTAITDARNRLGT